MLIVEPIQDKRKQEELCRICGAEYDPDLLACSAFDGDKLIGICQFEFKSGYALIHDLRQCPGVNDFEAMFIMTRGALNMIDLCGFHRAQCTANAGDTVLIKATGFKENQNGLFEIDLTDAFSGKCAGNCN